MAKQIIRVVAAAAAVSILSACGSMDTILPDQRAVYKKQKEAQEDLEVPPDLTQDSFKDALTIPSAGRENSTTYAEYMEDRDQRTSVERQTEVLPEIRNVSLQRDGDNRWLEVQAPAEEVWPSIVEFWRSNGILLVEQNPTAGVMRTGWLENRADIKQDFITEQLRKVVDGLYSSATRDQYQVRLERSAKPGVTEVYLTHHGMNERIANNTAGEPESSIWEPRGSDPELEAEMMQRLMVFLGVEETKAQRQLASAGKELPKSELTKSGDGAILLIREDFARAWRRSGIALDRAGFLVEDRNRSEGVYYVRYLDPEADSGEKGFFSKLAFWKGDDKPDTKQQYQIKLGGEGEETKVTVLDESGNELKTETATRILTLMHENIR